jgi:hypothetical protein
MELFKAEHTGFRRIMAAFLLCAVFCYGMAVRLSMQPPIPQAQVKQGSRKPCVCSRCNCKTRKTPAG